MSFTTHYINSPENTIKTQNTHRCLMVNVQCHTKHTYLPNGKCHLSDTHTCDLCNLDVLLQTALYVVVRHFTGVLLWDVGAKCVNWMSHAMYCFGPQQSRLCILTGPVLSIKCIYYVI